MNPLLYLVEVLKHIQPVYIEGHPYMDVETLENIINQVMEKYK